MRTTIRLCARCGGTHENLELRKIEPPIIIKISVFRKYFNYWGLCPVTKSPVLVNVTNK